MKIDYINPPWVFTDNGKRINMSEIIGQVRIGCTLGEDGERFKVTGNLADENCLNGVCDLKMPDKK